MDLFPHTFGGQEQHRGHDADGQQCHTKQGEDRDDSLDNHTHPVQFLNPLEGAAEAVGVEDIREVVRTALHSTGGHCGHHNERGHHNSDTGQPAGQRISPLQGHVHFSRSSLQVDTSEPHNTNQPCKDHVVLYEST